MNTTEIIDKLKQVAFGSLFGLNDEDYMLIAANMWFVIVHGNPDHAQPFMQFLSDWEKLHEEQYNKYKEWTCSNSVMEYRKKHGNWPWVGRMDLVLQ